MATLAVLYVDDRDPLIFYKPNSSWTRGGNVSDYDATSTFSGAPGASASITFSGRHLCPLFQALLCPDIFFNNWTLKGTGISVWGTIDHLDPSIPEFVQSSYSIDGGPTAIHNATEQPQFQFRQNFFQSDSLVPGSHTLVVTHLTNNNNARLFIDYFLVIPPNSSITLAPTSTLSTSATSSSSAVITAPPAGDGAKSHSGTTPTAAIIGGSLGGLALIGIAVFVFWLFRKRVKNNRKRREQTFQLFSYETWE